MEIVISLETDSEELGSKVKDWSSLWWPDWDEAGVEQCLTATLDDKVVGFITISGDNKCIAIEVHPDFQGKGIARRLCNESGCYRPEYNTNKDFWRAINNNATV